LARQLSERKGESVRSLLQDGQSLVISGDQLVELDNQIAGKPGEIIGKPGDHHQAVSQFQKMRGREHRLLTAITVSSLHKKETHLSVTKMSMRSLTDNEIQNYLKRDQPYDCAGSYKIEEAGISLFSSVTAEDFTSIQGIPMIWLCNKLKEYNCEFYRA